MKREPFERIGKMQGWVAAVLAAITFLSGGLILAKGHYDQNKPAPEPEKTGMTDQINPTETAPVKLEPSEQITQEDPRTNQNESSNPPERESIKPQLQPNSAIIGANDTNPAQIAPAPNFPH